MKLHSRGVILTISLAVALMSCLETQPDVTPPVTGGSLQTTGRGSSWIRLSWSAAADDVSLEDNLQYALFYSINDNIGTVTEVKHNGTDVSGYLTSTTEITAINLAGDTEYYFNVLVQDEAGNESVYTRTMESTLESTVSPAAIIADHTVVDEYDQIPEIWKNEVKKMLLSIPGESHGTGYLHGLQVLEDEDSSFAVEFTWDTEPEAYTEDYLRVTRTYRSIYGWWEETAGEGEFWTNENARDMMSGYLSYMRDTAGNTVSAFGFGWCWDMSWGNSPGGTADSVYGVRWAGSTDGGPVGNLRWGIDDDDNPLTADPGAGEAANTINLGTYLEAVDRYNTDVPETVTFYTTGPVDGYHGEESGYQRYLKHEAIREYVAATEGVLFDYADILSWEDGVQYMDEWNGHDFPNGDPDLATGDTGYNGSHITRDGCLMLGKAMWWMLARIAGWDGE